MILASLNCSGESLEKVIALFHSTYKTNQTFYNSFEKVLLFYTENLPKKNRQMYGVNGTYSCLVNNWSNYLSERELLYIQDNNAIISNLTYSGVISNRVSKKLKSDNFRFKKLLTNIPAEYIFKDYYGMVMRKFNKYYPNVEIIKLPVNSLLSAYINQSCGYDGKSKIYGLQADGTIGLYYLGNMDKIKEINMIKRICRSASLSPNIYVYIAMVDMYLQSNCSNYKIGYRPMTRYKRLAYDLAINNLNSNMLIIEPRNIVFGEVLDRYSCKLSTEERANFGIIDVFNTFLNCSHI